MCIKYKPIIQSCNIQPQEDFGIVLVLLYFLLAIDTHLKWSDSRRFAPQVWDQYNDLLPGVKLLNTQPTGVTFASVSYLIPLSVLGSMFWDVYKDKRSFYFHPLEKETPYPRSMYVFSLSIYYSLL